MAGNDELILRFMCFLSLSVVSITFFPNCCLSPAVVVVRVQFKLFHLEGRFFERFAIVWKTETRPMKCFQMKFLI